MAGSLYVPSSKFPRDFELARMIENQMTKDKLGKKALHQKLLEENSYRRKAHSVCGETVIIDAYTILNAYNHMSAEVQHAVKKLLAAGLRNGGKDYAKDVQESINQLNMDLERHAHQVYYEKGNDQ